MKKLICKIFSHKYRWIIIDKKTNKYVRVCKRCGEVQVYMFYMGSFIWSIPLEYTKQGAKKNIENYDGI